MEMLKVRRKILRHRLENGPLYAELSEQLTPDEKLLMWNNFIEQIHFVFADSHNSLCVFETLMKKCGITLNWLDHYGWDINDEEDYELKEVLPITTIKYIYG